MSVSAPIPAGVVSKLEGSVRVIRADGKSAGSLKVGDTLNQGDSVIAAEGARFQLTDANGQLWETPEGGWPVDQATGVGAKAPLAEVREALLAQGEANFDSAVARLNEANAEDAPAAGLTGGGAAGALAEGLRVERVQEGVGAQEYAYDAATLSETSTPFGGSTINGNAVLNAAPVVDPASPNYDPTSGNYVVATNEDTPVSGQVVANDPEGGTLSYAVGTAPSNGSVTVNADGTWTYTPSANFNGPDTFTVTVSDGQGGVTTATVAVGVTPVNDAPLAQADSATVAEGGSVLINVAGNDGDIDSALDLSSIVITSAPANGTVTLNADGTVSYVHNGSETTADSFSYTIKDAQGLVSAPVSVAITITGANDLPVVDPTSPGFDPVAGNYSVTTEEDTAVSGKVVATDADGDTLSYAIGTGPAHGTVTVNPDGTWTYTPSANFNGPDTFTVTVSDGQGGVTTATVTVGVTPVNDAPLAQADSATVAEGGSVLINVAGNDGDIDSALDLSSIVITSAPANGTVTLNADGTVSYVHNGSETSADSFSYTIKDAQGLVSAPVNVAITVTGGNDAPVIDPASRDFDPVAGNYSVTTEEDTAVSGKVVATDADGDTLAYALGTGPANGTVTVNTDGAWTYTPSANFNGPDTFTVTVSDGQGGVTTATVTVGVTPVNDAPLAQADSATVAEGGSVLINVAGNDGDIDSALDLSSIVITSAPANGTVTLNADGTVSYVHNGSETTADSFSYTIKDAQGLVSAPVSVAITITGANDLPVVDPTSPDFDPVAGNYSVTTEEDTAVSGKVIATDADGDTLSYAIGTGPAHGTVTVNPDGAWTYTPSANFNGPDTFTVTVSDGQGGVTTATVQVGVTPVNDAPVTANQSKTTAEDAFVTGKIVASDVDGDTLSYSVQSGVSHGTLVLNATTGDYTYTPAANYNGADSFTVRVSDGKGGFVDSVVNVTVTPVNDTPVVGTATSSLLEANLSAGAVTQAGSINVSDVDNQPLTVKLLTPSTALTSSGAAVVWSLSTDGKTLVGTAGATEVLRATIDNQGNYSVTLSKAIDHALVQGQNVASFNIGVSASDGSATTLSNLSVNITDDTPQVSAITHALRVRTDAINVNDLDAGFTGDTYINGTGQVARTNVDSHDTLIDRLRWGDAATSSGRSGYDLVDNANFTTSTGATINTGTPFKLGDFTHSNYGIYSGSSTLDYTDVTIRMDVVINGVSTPVAFTVRLNHTETTNSSDAIASRDIITLPAQAVSVQIAGQSYTVNLLGFQDRSGKIVNTIYTDESTNNNTFGIYAQVTSTQAPVQATGELLSQAGADGAYLSEIVIDGNRYAYNTANGGSVSVVSGTNQGTFSATEQVLTVKTALGGTFVVDLDDGNYTYTAPSNVTTSASDRLDFTVRDADGDTASSSVVVNVAPPVSVTLSNTGTPYQGNSDPENITGSSGNDTIYGGGGADHISGGGGIDTIYGGQGSDVLTGGQGADVFAWSLGDGGTPGNAYHDVISDFSTAARSAGGDVLDLRDLLQSELHTGTNVGNLTDFLRFETVGTNTVLHISSTGAYGTGGYTAAKDDQTITLQGVDLSSNNSLSNSQIIQNLLTAGKLITD